MSASRHVLCRASLRALPTAVVFLLVASSCSSDHARGTASEAPRPVPTLVSPVPGSVIKSDQRFTWSSPADEVALRIGSSQGAADLYESPALGAVTDHLVRHLPLTGAKVFVELRGRMGEQPFSVTAEYTLSTRRALCVLTDFADARLEQWTGDGFRSEQDLKDQLLEMEKHWDWLSRGREVAHWDLIRVQLSETLDENAFVDWQGLRDAVMPKVFEKIAADDYDADGDGIVDGVWIIVPDLGRTLPWLIGGESRHSGANVFVDGQSGGSAVGRQTGNFNHEFGHCLGLPDLYGPYGAVAGMTLMASPWEMPPNDFCAFDRYTLGWLAPRVVRETTRQIRLRPASEAFEAVLIPTTHSTEYFLLEYRKRAESGYGSQSPEYNGLAVLHAFDRSTQKLNPPLLKTEPADGQIEPNSTPETDDLLFPGNAKMQLPLEVKSYVGGHAVFAIENLAWVDGGIQFDVVMREPGSTANLLANGSFEDGTEPWQTRSDSESVAFESEANGRGGADSMCASIESRTESVDAAWSQALSNLEPSTPYLLCGWMRGEGVQPLDAWARSGAAINLLDAWDPNPGAVGTFGWQQFCSAFSLPRKMRVDVACRLGGSGSPAVGKVWCDDLTLEPMNLAY